jgi:outer membrane receptor protein involved in Fe transport
MHKKLILITTAATLVAPPWLAANAQAGGAGPEAIIVTARKRRESIFKVPVIQTVIAQEELER